jgi:hemerythrin superfamily protein
MAATSTNRSRPVAKRRPKAKGATTEAKSATRKATKKVTGRSTPAAKAGRATRKATKKVTGSAKAATKAGSAARKATKKVTGRATAASGSTGRRPSDVIALIKADHVAVNQLFKRYGDLRPGAFKSRGEVAERVIKELSVHAAVEEQILYPKVRTAVPNGERLVREALDEHQSVKKVLAELDKCGPESEKFDELMTRVRDEVRHHVKEEEASDGILGRLRKHTPSAELREMATLMRAAKKSAPTRPHPDAPSTLPGNIIFGAAAAVLDKARDTLTGRK